ncbi:hypothetical protein [Allostreptomyces psammosilenae]|uniref:Secreted protein n=1 Tax=Allostreptomyces psammosilenae TaxID=1892865 RepID=A0A853A2M8_9ACTN|nr:hypothetical protein [Allostreptomyces psammosilenae]NYI04772.1 hypothetical protein [Allostreptomyces psammosilenae]
MSPHPRIRAVLATGVLALGLSLAAPAEAQEVCSGTGPRQPDPDGLLRPTTYCRNLGGYVGPPASFGTGYLHEGRNWFVCQQEFPGLGGPEVGDLRSDWWLWTQGDVAYSDDGRGWFPATKIIGSTSDEPVPGVPMCRAE